MKDKKQNENRFWYLFLLIPVIWLALKTAPCFGGTFPEFVIEFGNAMMKPFNIVWCDASPVCIAVFTGVFLLAMGIYTSTRPNLRKGEEHGSARWAAIDEINSVVAQDEYIPLTKHIRLGMNSREHRKNLNILVIGGSGSGKTRNFAIPGILQETGSFVITDPKAEILSTVGYALKNAGYTIHVLNLIDMEHSDPYNPFAYIRSDSDVLKLITNLIKNTTPRNAAHQDPFWEKAETALLEALVFALRDYGSDEEKNFGTVMEMLTYADVREDDSSYRSPLDMFFDHIESSYPGNIASKQYSIYKQGAGKTAKSVNISLGVRLACFNIPAIRKLTDTDGMDIRSLGKKKTAVFAVIPDNDTSLSFIVGMLYTQIIQELYWQADNECGGSLPEHVRFVLDEFANVSLPSEFEKSLATMRSRNISATIVIQNLAQLKCLYRDGAWETITGNCDTLLYLGGNEYSTHEYISKMLGKQTIDIRTHGTSKGRTGSYSTNESTAGRELLKPDEVRTLDEKNAIVFIRGLRPVLDEKYDLMKHPNIKYTSCAGCSPFRYEKKYIDITPLEKAIDIENAQDYICLTGVVEKRGMKSSKNVG